MGRRRTPEPKSIRRINQNFKVTNVYAWDNLVKHSDDECYLVALTPRQIALLAMSIEPAHWSTRWRDAGDINKPDERFSQFIQQWVEDTEACLYMGCNVNDLLKLNRMLVAAIVGENVDLTDPVQLLPDAVDYTATGLVPNLGDSGDNSAVVRAIRQLTAAVDSQAVDLTIPIPDYIDYTDRGIAGKLEHNGETISEILNDTNTTLTLSHAELAAMAVAQGLMVDAANAVNQTLNETLQTSDEGGLENNINKRLQNLNITLGGILDGLDLIGIAESLAELSNIRKTLETSIDDGQGGVVVHDIASVANRMAVTLDRLRDNLDVVSDDSTEFGLAAVLHYYGAEAVDKLDKVRDNLDAYVASEDKEYGLAALIDGLNRVNVTTADYLRCIAEAVNAVCPPGVTPPALPFGSIEGKGQDDDWIAALERIRAEDIGQDPDEGRAELEDDLPDFDFDDAGTRWGVVMSVSAEYVTPSDPDTPPYLVVEITTSGRIETVVVWATGGYRSEHTIIADELETNVVYRFTIHKSILYDLPGSGSVHVHDPKTDETFFANWS